MLVFYIPAGYYIDMMMWRRRERARIRDANALADEPGRRKLTVGPIAENCFLSCAARAPTGR